MNIVSIIIKAIKQNFRDRKSMFMMVLFPIILILVLGSAFKSSFDTNTDIGTPKVFYSIESKGEASKNIKTYFIDRGKEFKIDFIKVENIEKAKEKILSTKEYAGLIQMKEDNKIDFFKNNKGEMNLDGSIVESTLDIFVQQYNILAEVQKINPSIIQKISEDTKADYSQVSSISKNKAPSSLDYYAIAEIALIIMYSGMTGLYSMAREKNSKTRARILSAPVKKYDFLFGSTLGGVLVTMIQIFLVIIFSKVVLKANFGSDMITVLALYTSEIVMAISLGVGLGFIFKQENVAGGVLNFIIPFIVFLGGGYVPVDGLGSKFFDLITYVSPVRWINKAIFQVIYNNDYSKVFPAIAVNVITALIFLFIASNLFRKESV